jgi:hypothetical protein
VTESISFVDAAGHNSSPADALFFQLQQHETMAHLACSREFQWRL